MLVTAKFICSNKDCGYAWQQPNPPAANCPKCKSLYSSWENYDEWDLEKKKERAKGKS